MSEEIDISQWPDWWKSLDAQFRAINYEPAMISFLGVLETAHQGYFDRSESPGGDPWPPLAPYTVRRKGHDTILVETGRLRSSLTRRGRDAIRETSHRGLIFGTEVPYAYFHQDGEGVPQREHVGMNEETLQILLDDVLDATVEGLKQTGRSAAGRKTA